MNMRRLLSLLVVLSLTWIPLVLLTGCESEDSPETDDLDAYFAEHPFLSDPRDSESSPIVSITPASADISFFGQQVVFTATGGRAPYRWDVARPAKGTVEAQSGTETAVYVANVVGPNNVIVYDQDGHAAVATINGPTTLLVATANPAEITQDNGLAILTASGGVPPYRWTVRDERLGHVESSGASVIYQRGGRGDNSVTVHDALENTYTLVIKQP